jgi:hypothetical protein
MLQVGATGINQPTIIKLLDTTCTHAPGKQQRSYVHKLGDVSAAKGTCIRDINIHTNTHEQHEIRVHQRGW